MSGFTVLFGEHQRVTVIDGHHQGVQGTILSATIAPNAASPITYIVWLDIGINERFSHEQLRGEDRKAAPMEIPAYGE